MPLAAALRLAASVVLGLLLPLLLVPATKSSPLMLCIAAALAVAALLSARGALPVWQLLRQALVSPVGMGCTVGLLLMLGTVPLAHAPAASLAQFVQFAIVIAGGTLMCLCFPAVAPRHRAVLFTAGCVLTAVLVISELAGGLWLRNLTGGREVTYSYNRVLVTLTLLIWPLFALAVASRKMWLILPVLLVLPVAVFKGESGTAVLAMLAGAAVFPVAFLLPALTRWVGLAAIVTLIAIQPWFGTLMQNLLGGGFHKRFENAHSSDRVDIWLSFEATVRAKWLLGNGFGSSLNLQNGPVAALIAPERVTLLGASHPHNAFLQLWVELGAVGAALATVLIVLLFRGIGRMRPGLQPFVLTWVAVTALVALVSHGAWQAWWWAAILACAAAFACLEAELRRGEPPL